MTEISSEMTAQATIGLKRLEAEFQNLNLDLLNAKLSENFDDTTKGVEEIFTATQKIQETVTSVLKWLSGKDTYLASIQDPMKRRIAVDEIAKKHDEAQGKLELCLGHEVSYFKLSAALAYLKYGFGQTYETTDDARKMLADLMARKLLVKADRGIQIGYEHYILGQEFGFEPADTKEITRWIGDYSRKLMILVRQERDTAVREIEREATITPDEVWDGNTTGTCVFKVPAESFMKWVGGEQKERWRGGGPLQVQVTARDIIPLSGKGGSLEKQVDLLRKNDVRLPRHTIKWDCPPGGDGSNSPGSKKAFQNLLDGVIRTRDLDADEAVEYIGKMRMLWHLIIRAYRAADSAKEQAELKKEFFAQSTISPEAFFGLNGSDQPADGDALLEFEGSFQIEGNPSISVFGPFVLARRSKENDRSVVEITRISQNAHDFLGQLIGKKFSEGEDFRELPGYMRRFFRAVRGRVEMARAVDQS